MFQLGTIYQDNRTKKERRLTLTHEKVVLGMFNFACLTDPKGQETRHISCPSKPQLIRNIIYMRLLNNLILAASHLAKNNDRLAKT